LKILKKNKSKLKKPQQYIKQIIYKILQI
jgi:hypothetical protein